MKYRTKRLIDTAVNCVFLAIVIWLSFRVSREVNRVNVRFCRITC